MRRKLRRIEKASSNSAVHRRRLVVEALESRRLLALNPTGDEQEFMQLVNRFRTDPAGEYNRLIRTTTPLVARDSVLQADLDFASVSGPTLRGELNALSPSPPVAWNEAIHNFNDSHNADMIARKTHFHTGTTARREALQAAGVNFRIVAGEKIQSENVYGFGKSPLHIFASYVIDWNRGGPGGMHASRGHRAAIHNPDYDQAGHAITPFNGTGFGPQVNSQVLANIENPPVTVVGAIFEDANSSGWYESGEGLSSVRFVFQGAAGTFETTGYATGGYQIELPPGTYTATATGGGMKFPQTMTNIVVGNTNVWKNWIYDPDFIPPDALEANNSIGQATDLGSTNQARNSLNIHSSSDVDFFKFVPNGTGAAQIRLSFSQADGDVDMQLLNASGTVIASSTSSTSNELITQNVSRGDVYYVRVFGKAGSDNEGYALQTSLPAPTPPVAAADRAILNGASSVSVDVIANDMDADGDRAQLLAKLSSGAASEFSLVANEIVFSPLSSTHAGVHRANYTVIDDQGLESAPASVSVFVVDYSQPTPWKNGLSAFDINDDGANSAIDALLVINDLNLRGSRMLPTSPLGGENLFGFLDPSGDGFISPLDALVVINELNKAGEGEGERGSSFAIESPFETTDAAAGYFYAADLALANLAAELEQKRRK